tara:strand:+ start:5936 stop:6436 length:501 start_codon:yes stop_codon:yes gene_type:complete
MSDRPDLPTLALSVRQPWAWAIIHGGKDVENRVKRAITMGRMKPGRICIHASRGMTQDEYESAESFMASIGVSCPRPDKLVRGGVIGTVMVTGSAKDSDSDWFFGPWCLTLENPLPVEPIPASGELGYFQWKPGGEFCESNPWMKAWPKRWQAAASRHIDEAPTLI